MKALASIQFLPDPRGAPANFASACHKSQASLTAISTLLGYNCLLQRLRKQDIERNVWRGPITTGLKKLVIMTSVSFHLYPSVHCLCAQVGVKKLLQDLQPDEKGTPSGPNVSKVSELKTSVTVQTWSTAQIQHVEDFCTHTSACISGANF